MNNQALNINDKTFYRYYPVYAQPFTVSYEAKNKYGFGIYFLDNPLYYANLYKPSSMVAIQPQVSKPMVFDADRFNHIPNQNYLKSFFEHVRTHRAASTRNDFNEHLLAQGYDSIVVHEPRGTYLLLLTDDASKYRVLSKDAEYRKTTPDNDNIREKLKAFYKLLNDKVNN